ncbi:S41 family peptidase [bacterium BMS3Abin03]|jgi:carboxyl-terminal processing protease|nr:S41 family peptidase [bacterium BMS3Abin03]
MKFKHLKVYLIGTVIVLLFAGFTDIYFEINKNLELFGKVYKEISFNYVDEVDPEQFMRAGIQGMLSSLDPYTIFIDEKKKEDIDLITNGKYGGIGISIGVRDDKVTIVEVMEGYSAQRQGLEVGDIIIEAAGVKIGTDNLDEISSLVKGDPGTTVSLKIVRDELKDTIDFDVVREEVIIKNLTYAGFYPEGSNNLYLKLSNFSRSASEEIRDAIKDAKAQKEIKSVVLDLRGNPGGLLDIAVDICDKFLPKDYLIVSTKGRSPSSIKEFYSTQEPLLKDAKLIVLIDGGSASASEIVAGAIQDHDRGIILGTKSFGKGLVQTITPLSYNTSLKITTAKYYTPSGRCIQKIDYSDNNDVIAEEDSIVSGKFLTDHKRVVYSKGGISPDTTIAFNIEGKLTQELLAHGLFFKFANHYYYQHTDENYNSIKDEDLLTQFKDFINNENFVYKSDAEDHVDELISDLSGNYPNLTNEVGRLKAEITNLKKNDFNLYKDEILRELRTEIAYRYLGSDARIKEQLNCDMQFQSALNIFNNPIVYNKLLHLN